MMEMTTEQVRALTPAQVIAIFLEAHRKGRNHEAITWEFGNDLVTIVEQHGDKIAAAIEKTAGGDW